MTDGTASSSSFLSPTKNVLGGRFPRNVHLDLVIFLDVLHLRQMYLYNAFLVHFVKVRHFVVVTEHKVVDGRLRFLNLFSGRFNRDFVLVGRLRVLEQIQDSSMVSFTFTMSAMIWQPASVTSQSPKTSFLISCSIKFSVLRFVSGVGDHFVHVVGVLLGVLLRNLLLDLLRDFWWLSVGS